MKTPLWPHQVQAVAELRDRLRAGLRRVMIQIPVGGGKTLLAASIVEGALAKGNRVIFTVPLLSLVDQTVAAFEAEGIDAVGVMQGFHPRSDARQPVQVCSIQTLEKRRFPEADLVIVDEAHILRQSYGRWMNEATWSSVPFVGLSATPWSRGLGKLYQDLIVPTTIQALIEEERLAPFRVFAPSHPDLKGVRTRGGDYREDDLAEAMNKPHLTADVVATWLQRGEDRPTFVFAVNRAHAKALQREFDREKISTAYIDAYTDLDERNAIRERFHAGQVRVVCNVATLTTGVDWDVRCIVLARPTRSRMLFVQLVGRGLRKPKGKTDLILLDHSDTTLKLGFVTDIVQEHLDDGKTKGPAERKVETPLPVQCPSPGCTFLKPPKTAICPACGFKAERQHKVVCEDGDLIEIRPKDRRSKQFSAIERWEMFGMLKHYGQMYGYKHGWAAMKFRELTGVYPDGVEKAPPIEPSPHILRWIRSRNIRFAKSRTRHAA